MKLPHFENDLHESAWQELAFEFKSAGMAGPESGFTNRWQRRLAKHHEAVARRQAWVVFSANVVIALGFLTLMGLRIVPGLPGPNQFITIWVELFAQIVIFIKMSVGLLDTLTRTLPGVVPVRWWLSIFGSFGMLILFWVSMIRQQVQEQGANE